MIYYAKKPTYSPATDRHQWIFCTFASSVLISCLFSCIMSLWIHFVSKQSHAEQVWHFAFHWIEYALTFLHLIAKLSFKLKAILQYLTRDENFYFSLFSFLSLNYEMTLVTSYRLSKPKNSTLKSTPTFKSLVNYFT